MTNHYEQIKLACQKANPKLLELSMGCELLSDFWTKCTIIGKCYWWWDVKRWPLISTVHDYAIENGTYSVLWHPPTLADVLLALGERWSINWKWQFIYYLEGGIWYVKNLWNKTQKKYFSSPIIDLSLPVRDWWEEALKFLALELGYNL